MDEFRDYVREHRIQFEKECPQPCTDALWWYYGEYHALDSPQGKVSKNSGIPWNRCQSRTAMRELEKSGTCVLGTGGLPLLPDRGWEHS